MGILQKVLDALAPLGVREVASADPTDRELFITGDELVDRVYSAVQLRRSVLVTGPRGSGKSYCVGAALKRATRCNPQVIGGWHFLQGNREIPRDYLSEDMLIISRSGTPELLDALAIREPASGGDGYQALLKARRMKPEDLTRPYTPEWPALSPEFEHQRHELWATTPGQPNAWIALFLDEINRFGDGFLDSLLSLLEEGIVVRRGQSYHVPIVVVATANPPGYDITAKKLSPPLQARIARAYRVSQPPIDHLVYVILAQALPSQTPDLGDLRFLVAAATLCLWGDPDDRNVKGTAFLTPGTKALLRAAMKADPVLSERMREISRLVVFGPDARAVSDWVRCAWGTAEHELRAKHNDIEAAKREQFRLRDQMLALCLQAVRAAESDLSRVRGEHAHLEKSLRELEHKMLIVRKEIAEGKVKVSKLDEIRKQQARDVKLQRTLRARIPEVCIQVVTGTAVEKKVREIHESLGQALHRQHADEAQLSTTYQAALARTAVESLGHKVREAFNEGAEPDKSVKLEACLRDIVARVLEVPALRDIFVVPYAAAEEQLAMAEGTLFDHVTKLPEERWHPWVRALATLPADDSVETYLRWRQGNAPRVLFTDNGAFVRRAERDWLTNVFTEISDRRADATKTIPDDAQAVFAEALATTRYAAVFGDELRNVLGNRIKDISPGSAESLVDWIEQVLDPAGPQAGLPAGEALPFMKPVLRRIRRNADPAHPIFARIVAAQKSIRRP